MKRIYLDNAATSFPKAKGVSSSMKSFIDKGLVNPNRTDSIESEKYFESEYSLREKMNSLLSGEGEDSVIFTHGITESLNFLIKGSFKKGDHVIISSCEHNSVMRPLNQMGIEYTKIKCDRYGYNDYSNLESLVKENTKGIICSSGGNVSGAIQDLTPLSVLSKKYNLLFFIDSAQSLPFFPLSLKDLNATSIAFTFHKGFLGPEGVGGFIGKKDFLLSLNPLISGGSGSMSDKEEVPTTLPDRLEAGTMNTPGIIGSEKALSYVLKNFDRLKENERNITSRLYKGLEEIDEINIVGAPLEKERNSVISITSKLDISSLSYSLLKEKGIETRVGLHCSPSSCKALGVFPLGTLRLSPGPFTTHHEIDLVIKTLKKIIKRERS